MEAVFNINFGDDEGEDLEYQLKTYPMISLKSLTMKDFGVYTKQNKNTVLREFTRTPTLEVLDMSENYLCVNLLVNLCHYCPKLRSLDLSNCAIDFYDSIDFRAHFDGVFAGLTGLAELFLNSVIQFDSKRKKRKAKYNLSSEIKYFGSKYEGDILQSCIDSICQNLRQLEVLEMSEYPDMSNEQVVQLIVSLSELKQLRIEECVKIDNSLLSLLADHLELCNRKQVLVLMVHGTGMVEGDGLVVPNMVRIEFDVQKKRVSPQFQIPM